MFRQKIKTREELAKAIGKPPRSKTVIMCHGAFDIVHPGHLRHLMYAKEKADLLIASITADDHITKAEHRPFVPQELRAASLAALEMVDYVIIDPNPTPIQNIRRLQPDFFAKGYEYFANGVPPKTQEEMDTLAGVRVHVVGDTIVDSYSYCSLLGATAKSPTFSVKHDFTERFSGGAAVVAKHVRSAGASVTFSTVLGNDELRGFVELDLAQDGIQCLPVLDATRPTTHKERFI